MHVLKRKMVKYHHYDNMERACLLNVIHAVFYLNSKKKKKKKKNPKWLCNTNETRGSYAPILKREYLKKNHIYHLLRERPIFPPPFIN
jgi:hypothetical protein